MSQSQRIHPPAVKTQDINGFVKLPRKLGMRGGRGPWGLVWLPFSDGGKSSPQYSLILNIILHEAYSGCYANVNSLLTTY